MKGNTREVLDLLAASDLSVETKLGLQQFVSIRDLLDSQDGGSEDFEIF